jgi:hypothetical protein
VNVRRNLPFLVTLEAGEVQAHDRAGVGSVSRKMS